MAEPFLGEIRMFSNDYPPKGWLACEGQLLPIDRNQALFSLLGNTYGGDGRRTFGLPDLRSRAPSHASAELRLGATQDFAGGPPGAGPRRIAITFCIAVEGIFPSQS